MSTQNPARSLGRNVQSLLLVSAIGLEVGNRDHSLCNNNINVIHICLWNFLFADMSCVAHGSFLMRLRSWFWFQRVARPITETPTQAPGHTYDPEHYCR